MQSRNLQSCSSCKLTERTTRVDEQTKCCYEGIWCEDQCEENKGHVYISKRYDQQVEPVGQFTYLGSWISDDKYATKDIFKARTAMVRHSSWTRKIVNRETEL